MLRDQSESCFCFFNSQMGVMEANCSVRVFHETLYWNDQANY